MKSKTYYITLICILLFPFSSAFGFQATFSPRFSITEEYSDNIFLAAEDEEDDFITILSVGFTVQLLGKFSGLDLTYDPSYAIYDEFYEYDGWRHSAELSCWTDISRNTRLELNNSSFLTEDPYLTDYSSSRRSREPYYTNTANLGLTHQFGESDSINLGYEYRILENEDENIEDNTRHGPSIDLTYWFIPRQLGFETNVSYTRAEFEISPPLEVSDNFDYWNGRVRLIKNFTRHLEGFVRYVHTDIVYDKDPDAEPSENYQVYNPSAGFNYTTEDDILLSFNIGYFLREMEESDNESGLSAIAVLTKTYSRGSLNITGSGGYEESLFIDENLGFSKFYETRCSATYQLTRHISGNIFGSYRNDKYEDIDPEREDKSTRGGFGLTIQPLMWMSFGLNYTYNSLDSTLDTYNYEENRGLIKVTLSSPLPTRTSQE